MMAYVIVTLRLLFHMERVEWVRYHVPESQSMVGGTKSVCERLRAGGGRIIRLDGMATTTRITSVGHNKGGNLRSLM